ncbi:uncharacterized protein MELLADRAFT_71900 [Melampsora larici-populina 98AG31]|uniref:Uncharacterized protein n=1 Tax=Melampsora larici-populina (strain 98AG31 / pathotype 3-4-7) TaxID=747676 RepID=F4RM54_MELLP|nr:uncharacterized protein MELLADRAFT_71900 [Melampsora larici-populina 98AG31]EGG06366.1 hypothetical protein MELLADRAFT_71900 [Melampsora larici-populina 98AG31]
MQNYETHHSMESNQSSHLNYRFSNHTYPQAEVQDQIDPEESIRSSNQSKSNLTSSSASSSEIKRNESQSDLIEGEFNEESFELDDSSKLEKLVSEILCLDSNGQLLPYNSNQIKSLQSVWNSANSNHTITHPSSDSVQDREWFNDQTQRIEPIWLKNLRESVLFDGSKSNETQNFQTYQKINSIQEDELVFEIQQNLRSLVNGLNQDQWLYPSPTAFSPSLSIQSNSLNLGLEGTSSEIINHEKYLETDFNLHSLPSSSSSEEASNLLLPPRQLWLGEEEDKGLESEVSLIDLLNTTPTTTTTTTTHHHHHQVNLGRSGELSQRNVHQSRRNMFQQRHAQGSALARQVSRLGMSE